MNRLPKTRHSLLLRLGDPDNEVAWREFLEVYEVAVHRYACSRGLQSADAEDVTQRVLAAVLDKAQTWEANETKGSFGAWLFKVTRNLSAKAWNDRKRAVVGSGDSASLLMLTELAEPTEEEKTLFHLGYRKALFHWAAERIRDQVQEQTWRAFWMSAMEDIAAASVARELGMSLSSVYTAKCRVLTRIRNEVERFEDEFQFAENRESK